MKKMALVCALTLVMTASAMAAGGKIAYVDTQAVFEKTSLGKNYQGILRDYFESRKKILDLDAADIQKLREDYDKQRQAKLLNEKAQKEKEETINLKINEIRKKQDEFGAELQKKQEELFSEFNQKMNAVLRNIAKKEKVSMVMSRSIIVSKANIPSVLYADDDLDLTEKVITEMNKQ